MTDHPTTPPDQGGEGGWHPIATAPRDGSWIILFSARAEPHVTVGYWESEPFFPDEEEPSGWVLMEADAMPSFITPTHWQPLPAAPEHP